MTFAPALVSFNTGYDRLCFDCASSPNTKVQTKDFHTGGHGFGPTLHPLLPNSSSHDTRQLGFSDWDQRLPSLMVNNVGEAQTVTLIAPSDGSTHKLVFALSVGHRPTDQLYQPSAKKDQLVVFLKPEALLSLLELSHPFSGISWALELHNTELLRRPMGVDLAEEKGEYTYSRRASKEEAILILQTLVICFQKGLLIHMQRIPMHLIRA
ncbi:hypothetical protein JHK82_052545 [Glycine max]|nr:hypothetical protein JHK86_052389 [Glycine max]KAG5085148.1 hypothetical protein JHK82_052545 [Glycine max]